MPNPKIHAGPKGLPGMGILDFSIRRSPMAWRVAVRPRNCRHGRLAASQPGYTKPSGQGLYLFMAAGHVRFGVNLEHTYFIHEPRKSPAVLSPQEVRRGRSSAAASAGARR